MTLNTALTNFPAKIFPSLQKDLDTLNDQITAYNAQKRKISCLVILAFATLATFTVKLIWNRLSGAELKIAISSSSSIILGLFDLTVGSGALWYWIDKNNKTKQIDKMIRELKTPKNFYGEVSERRKDSVTAPEVLNSIKENLKPLFAKSVPIELDYIFIKTNEFTVEGNSADNFKIFPEKKIKDNWSEIETTIAVWRSYYSELYKADPAARTSVVMQAIALQCIQDLPSTEIDDGKSHYHCSSPTIQDPKNGSIAHYYQLGLRKTKIMRYSSPSAFREHLEQEADASPKAKRLTTLSNLDERYLDRE